MKNLRIIAAMAFAGVVSSALAAEASSAAPLQSQIDAAAPGATIHVPAGVHEGNLIINKPLRLVGERGAEIRGTGRGKVIEITAPDVTVDGFLISNSGRSLMADDAAIHISADRATIANNRIEDSLHGIYLKKANDCRITGNTIIGTAVASNEDTSAPGDGPENCDATPLLNGPGNGIHQWSCSRTLLENNTITRTRDGIYFYFTDHCLIKDNVVTQVRYGLHYMYSDDNVFEGNRFSENAGGAAVMLSERLTIRDNDFIDNRGGRAMGLILLSVDDSLIENNRIERNSLGLSLNQCNGNRLIGNTIDSNHLGLMFNGNSDVNSFSANSFRHNLYPVEMNGDSGTTRWELAGVGNRWDNVAPVDFNADGISDLPHRELDVLGYLRRNFPPIGLLADSPALRLLRFAHQRAAIPGFNAIQDNAPLLGTAPAASATQPTP